MSYKIVERGDGWIKAVVTDWVGEFPPVIIVPWVKIKGNDLTVNYYTLDALEIIPMIEGWGSLGLYVRGRNPVPLVQHVNNIDWGRVYRVQELFEIGGRGSRGVTIWDQRKQCLVSHARWDRLHRQCFKSVSDEKFKKEFDWAVAWCEARPIKPGAHLLYSDGIHVQH